MSMRGYRFLATEIKFDETAQQIMGRDPNSNNLGERVMLLRTGTFHHANPVTKEDQTTEITPLMLATMLSNFKSGIRGIDIAIDYKHDNQNIAAGWIRELELSEDGTILYATKLAWTPKGLQTLADKEFRYISAEFHPNYTDNETLQSFGPTLLGAGLTNRPVVKRMEPIVQLSEGGLPMSQEAIKLLNEKIELLEKANKKLAEECAEEKKKLEELEMSPEEMLAKIKELEAELAKLKGEKEVMAQEKALAEKKSQFAKLLSEGKAVPAQETAFLAGDFEKFVSLAGKLNLSESGHAGSTGNTNEKDAQDQVIDLAQKKVNESKGSISFSEAVSSVLSENKQLRAEYEKAVAL